MWSTGYIKKEPYSKFLYDILVGYTDNYLFCITVITLCFRTPPLFQRPKTCFSDTLCFRTPPFFTEIIIFSVRKHRLITASY